MSKASISTLILSGLLLVTGCDDTTGPERDGSSAVEVRFTTSSPGQSSLVGASLAVGTAGDSLMIEGSNGTLVIRDIRMVVDEFELEGHGAGCPLDDDDDDPDERECEFESPRFFLDLPLDDGAVPVADELLPEGTYDELEFEVEDIDLDEEGEDDDDVSILAAEIRSEFPEWPAEASVLVDGTFIPTDGDAQDFRAFFEAEIEVEMALDPPLVVDAEGGNRVITVEVRPESWFQRIDGSVLNLALLDYETTGQVAEFEAEFEDGFVEIEHDGD